MAARMVSYIIAPKGLMERLSPHSFISISYVVGFCFFLEAGPHSVACADLELTV